MHHRLLATIVALTVAAPRGRADEAAPRPITEDELIAAIEASDPRLARRAAALDVAHAEVLAAGLRPEPSLAVDREEVFARGGRAPTNYLRVAWPVDLAGRRGRRVVAARANLAAETADLQAARFALVVDGLRTFRLAAYARLRSELLQVERAALVRAVEIVRKRAAAGDAAGYEARRLELELAAYDDLAASAAIELEAARRRLALAVGRDQPIDAASELALPVAPRVDALLAGAVAGRGDYQAAKLRGEAADAERAVADRAWVPEVSLTGGVMTSDLGDETALGYVAGVALSLPFFDRGQVGRARARAAHRIADADVRILEQHVPPMVRLAHEVLIGRIDQARAVATGQLDRLDGLLLAVEASYREGEASVLELLDAHRTARDVRLRALELRRDASLDELELWFVLGHRP